MAEHQLFSGHSLTAKPQLCQTPLSPWSKIPVRPLALRAWFWPPPTQVFLIRHDDTTSEFFLFQLRFSPLPLGWTYSYLIPTSSTPFSQSLVTVPQAMNSCLDGQAVDCVHMGVRPPSHQHWRYITIIHTPVSTVLSAHLYSQLCFIT